MATTDKSTMSSEVVVGPGASSPVRASATPPDDEASSTTAPRPPESSRGPRWDARSSRAHDAAALLLRRAGPAENPRARSARRTAAAAGTAITPPVGVPAGAVGVGGGIRPPPPQDRPPHISIKTGDGSGGSKSAAAVATEGEDAAGGVHEGYRPYKLATPASLASLSTKFFERRTQSSPPRGAKTPPAHHHHAGRSPPGSPGSFFTHQDSISRTNLHTRASGRLHRRPRHDDRTTAATAATAPDAGGAAGGGAGTTTAGGGGGIAPAAAAPAGANRREGTHRTRSHSDPTLSRRAGAAAAASAGHHNPSTHHRTRTTQTFLRAPEQHHPDHDDDDDDEGDAPSRRLQMYASHLLHTTAAVGGGQHGRHPHRSSLHGAHSHSHHPHHPPPGMGTGGTGGELEEHGLPPSVVGGGGVGGAGAAAALGEAVRRLEADAVRRRSAAGGTGTSPDQNGEAAQRGQAGVDFWADLTTSAAGVERYGLVRRGRGASSEEKKGEEEWDPTLEEIELPVIGGLTSIVLDRPPVAPISDTHPDDSSPAPMEEEEDDDRKPSAAPTSASSAAPPSTTAPSPRHNFANPDEAFSAIKNLFSSAPRRVCQHPFRRNDIVWVCRTCQADETCVLCHDCYRRSDHRGHDVAFYHAQAGGCCDCGDPDAWDPAGFCDVHGGGGGVGGDGSSPGENEDMLAAAHGVVLACVEYLVEVARDVDRSFVRPREEILESGDSDGCLDDDEEEEEECRMIVEEEEGEMARLRLAGARRGDYYRPVGGSRGRTTTATSMDYAADGDLDDDHDDGADADAEVEDVEEDDILVSPGGARGDFGGGVPLARLSNDEIMQDLRDARMASVEHLGDVDHVDDVDVHTDAFETPNQSHSVDTHEEQPPNHGTGIGPWRGGQDSPAAAAPDAPMEDDDDGSSSSSDGSGSGVGGNGGRRSGSAGSSPPSSRSSTSMGGGGGGTDDDDDDTDLPPGSNSNDDEEVAAMRLGTALLQHEAHVAAQAQAQAEAEEAILAAAEAARAAVMEEEEEGNGRAALRHSLRHASYHSRQTAIDEARNISRSLSAGGSGTEGPNTPIPTPPSRRARPSSSSDRLLELATRGRDEGGLFLVLHGDDVHDLNGGSSSSPSTPNSTAADARALSDLFNPLNGASSDPYGHRRHHAHAAAPLVSKILRLTKLHGELCLWGTSELIAELGHNAASLWRDGDRVSTKRVGRHASRRARALRDANWSVSVKTHGQFEREQRAAACVQFLSVLAGSCDALCSVVAGAVGGGEGAHLVPLLGSDLKLPRVVTGRWHALLLTLLAVPRFKMELAVAYCDTYGSVTREYARGIGISDCSSFTLSVQFLNRQTYVRELAANRHLLSRLTGALLATLHVASIPDESRRGGAGGGVGGGAVVLNPLHPVLSHRRYSPCISDLKCVLNVAGMARQFATACLGSWIEALSVGQGMDRQVWRGWTEGHVETEPRGWVGAFNCSISLGSLFERVLAWEDTDEGTPIEADCGSPVLLTCAEITRRVLAGVDRWQRLETMHHRPTPNASNLPEHARCPASLPYSTVHVNMGTALAQGALPISQVRPWSFHYPLHRFLAVCLRELARRTEPEGGGGGGAVVGGGGVSAWMRMMEEGSSSSSSVVDEYSLRGLLEFPALALSRAAQIRSGLWKRNGPGMQDQVLNYGEPPFCRTLRDADLTLIQFATLGLNSLKSVDGERKDGGTAYLVNLLLHRFGVFDFAGFARAPNRNVDRYSDEVAGGLYPRELSPRDGGDGSDDNGGTNNSFSMDVYQVDGTNNEAVLPWTYSPARGDAVPSLSLLEELLHLLIILVTELPNPPSRSGPSQILHAKRRLRREVVHRLVSGPKTHSELAEVHHVLPQRDNSSLSEEGKLLNPDDAGGAALEATLNDVAERKPSRGLAPDHWVLRKDIWDEYDPAFYHVGARAHQSAAENRPRPTTNNNFGGATSTAIGGSGVDPPPGGGGGVPPSPYAPRPAAAHAALMRLRRDFTADAVVVALMYRMLHVHCANTTTPAEGGGQHDELRGKFAYEKEAMSETALARAVHLLTLGAYCWADDCGGDSPDGISAASDGIQHRWRERGGGGCGSIFGTIPRDAAPPEAKDWIEAVLLARPSQIMDCEWYGREDSALILLQRLAVKGVGRDGGFVSQDAAVRSGAAWLCEFAARHSEDAAKLLGGLSAKNRANKVDGRGASSEMERRRREARERALRMMKANAAKFAATMVAGSDEEDDDEAMSDVTPTVTRTHALKRNGSSISGDDTKSAVSSSVDMEEMAEEQGESSPSDKSQKSSLSMLVADSPEKLCAKRTVGLLKERPRCIICSDDGNGDLNDESGNYDESSRGSNGRRPNRALAFCGHAQASTVLKGGGGPSRSPGSVNQFVGVHIALCGHAVHSSCCDSYLASVGQRDSALERMEAGKRGEFRCPMCQRLSNCLVPFIDVEAGWIDSVSTKGNGAPESDRLDVTGDDVMDVLLTSSPCKTKEEDAIPVRGSSLNSFLSGSTWSSDLASWDGRCNFIRTEESCLDSEVAMGSDIKPSRDVDRSGKKDYPVTPPRSSRLRVMKSMRSFGKKDLLGAWNVVMRTPRFRRKHSRGDSSLDITRSPILQNLSTQVSNEQSGGVEVWRRLMDQVSDVSHRADLKRLGEESLFRDYGEFRHYLLEKVVYNGNNRAIGKEPVDWPMCISGSLTESRQHEFAREKLISKLLLTIQAFTLSCCAEAAEVRRLYNKAVTATGDVGTSGKSFFPKFGVQGVFCDGMLVCLPEPSLDDGGEQPFEGRLGKLRFLGLAVMSAASAVSRETMQLALSFPGGRCQVQEGREHAPGRSEPRAPVTYPILCGHVLTHTVAAMCATCGRGMATMVLDARSDDEQSDQSYCLGRDDPDGTDVVDDCENIIKLGFLARVLQVLLGSMDAGAEQDGSPGNAMEVKLLNNLEMLLGQETEVPSTAGPNDWDEFGWRLGCSRLLRTALEPMCDRKQPSGEGKRDDKVIERFGDACLAARIAGEAFLSDAGLILQILAPGVLKERRLSQIDDSNVAGLSSLEQLARWIRMESISDMLKSDVVRDVIAWWYEEATARRRAARTDPQNDFERQLASSRCFRVSDWPITHLVSDASAIDNEDSGVNTDASAAIRTKALLASSPRPASEHLATVSDVSTGMISPTAELSSPLHPLGYSDNKQHFPASIPSYTSKKCVPLLGGYSDSCDCKETSKSILSTSSRARTSLCRISFLPTSYTDLYAQLGILCPDSDQTALCLVCGAVLNAGGKGECTKHAVQCGAGCGLFFLLQECVGLILHGGRAAYVHSPYVDSHGETPQYRGRPLNLDLDRYDILHEMWAGHLVRERVITERANSRQVIIANFY